MFGAVRRSAQESLKRAAELLDARHASKASQSGRVQGSWKRNSASSCPRLTRLLAADGDRGELDSWACATPHNAASQRGCHKSRAHPGIRYRSPSPSLWASHSFGDPNTVPCVPRARRRLDRALDSERASAEKVKPGATIANWTAARVRVYCLAASPSIPSWVSCLQSLSALPPFSLWPPQRWLHRR